MRVVKKIVENWSNITWFRRSTWLGLREGDVHQVVLHCINQFNHVNTSRESFLGISAIISHITLDYRIDDQDWKNVGPPDKLFKLISVHPENSVVFLSIFCSLFDSREYVCSMNYFWFLLVGSAFGKDEKIFISKIECSPVLGGFAIVLSDGRGGFLSSSTTEAKPKVR